MRKLLLMAWAICSTQLFAQNHVSSFQQLGYEDQTITGINGALTYYLRVHPNDDLKNGSLQLQLQASGIISPANSYLTVYCKNSPVGTFRVSGTDSLINIRIPLKEDYVQPDGRFMQLKLQARLASSDEICRDLNNPAIWLTVKKSSSISFSRTANTSYQQSLLEALQDIHQVYLPSKAATTDLAAAAAMYARLKRLVPASEPIQIGNYTTTDSFPSAIITGIKSRLPAFVAAKLPNLLPGQGILQVIHTAEHHYFVISGSDEAGYKKAASLLSDESVLAATFSDRLMVSQSSVSGTLSATLSASSDNLSLKELGGNGALMEGIGNLQSVYTFTADQFNTIPTAINFHLEANYTAIRETDRAYLNVYLNENLAYTQSLNTAGSIKTNITLPAYLLTKFNVLKIEFRFNPDTDVCKDGFVNYFAGVNVNASRLSFSGSQTNSSTTFFHFPFDFKTKTTALVISPELLSKGALAVGELFYQLNRYSYNGSFYFPSIYSSTEMDSVKSKDISLITCLLPTDPFVNQFKQIPVKYNREFVIYPNQDGSARYTFNQFLGSGMAQIFKEGGRTILAITAFGEDSTGHVLADVIKGMNEQITNLEANICIANGNSRYFFQSADNGKFVLYEDDPAKFDQFWKRYQYWLLAGVLILIFLAFLFVSNKVKQSQSIINENSND